MKSKWKLRAPFFRGANTYQIGPKDGEQIEVVVDKNGFFELATAPNFVLGVFAEQADRDVHRSAKYK